MKLKRNEIAYAIARNCTDFYISTRHRIEVNGVENIPKIGSGLIIPKHQFKRDISLEGYILNKYAERPANWIMKYSLPKCFEKVGAVRVYTQKNIRKKLKEITDKLDKQKFKEKVKETNDSAIKYIKELCQNNELIVLHAEGTRNPNEMNKINMSLIKYINQIQKELGIEIPLILMGIDYQEIEKRGSDVIVNMKQLAWNTPNLEQAIFEELAELSNISLEL